MKEDKLEEGCFVQLKMGRWDAKTRIPTSKLGKGIPAEIITTRQDIIDDRILLKDLTTIRRMAKGLLKRNSLPFPIDGIFWVPKDKIPMLNDGFATYKTAYELGINKLCENIKKMETEFKNKYPDYYNKQNYPSQSRLRKKFYFYWNFMHFTAPSKKIKTLSPALYKNEQAKFSKMIVEMEEMTINLIGNSLLARIDRLSSQCESGKINNGTVKSIDKFLKHWNELWEDHIDEKKLKSVMATLKKQMASVSSDRLKNNEDFRNKFNQKLEKIAEQIKVIPDFKLKRKLDI